VYAIHRLDFDKAQQLLEKAVSEAYNLLYTVFYCRPSLAWGSFSNAMEEYAEARLFLNSMKSPTVEGKFYIEDYADMPIHIDAYNYIGALSDLSGEITRYCVAEATKRNVKSVKTCLATNSYILGKILQMQLSPKMVESKLKAVRINTSKSQNILYQLTLLGK